MDVRTSIFEFKMQVRTSIVESKMKVFTSIVESQKEVRNMIVEYHFVIRFTSCVVRCRGRGRFRLNLRLI